MKKITAIVILAIVAASCTQDDGSADFARGAAAYANHDLQTAKKSFAAAAKKNPANADTRLQLALAEYDLGEPDAADAAIKEARALNPDSAEYRLAEGNIAYLKKDYARATKLYNEVSSTKELPAQLRSQALVSRAVAELAQENITSARLSLLRAMRLDRRNAAAWYHLAILSRNTFHFDTAALEQFEMFSRLAAPSDERTQNTVRNTIPRLRDSISKAAASIVGAAKRNPGLAAKLLAEKKYAAAFAADPLSYPAAIALAKHLDATDHSAKGVDSALAAYLAAADQNPSSQATYISAAKLAMRNGRFATAANVLSRAIAHNPENREVVDMMVETLRKSGKAKAAEAALWQAYRKEL